MVKPTRWINSRIGVICFLWLKHDYSFFSKYIYFLNLYQSFVPETSTNCRWNFPEVSVTHKLLGVDKVLDHIFNKLASHYSWKYVIIVCVAIPHCWTRESIQILVQILSMNLVIFHMLFIILFWSLLQKYWSVQNCSLKSDPLKSDRLSWTTEGLVLSKETFDWVGPSAV